MTLEGMEREEREREYAVYSKTTNLPLENILVCGNTVHHSSLLNI